ncbi:MAG: NAD+ synthase [Bdellovibrionales bacterium]
MAQINCVLGDVKTNISKILDNTIRAKKKNCDLVVFPELSLFGYWPADLLERQHLIDDQLKEIEKLQNKLPEGIAILVGGITRSKKKEKKDFKNSAIFLQKGKRAKIFSKELLPNYDVFDETRHFSPGDLKSNILKYKGKRIHISICEDIWAWGEAWVGSNYPSNPIKSLRGEKFDLLINLSASPFSKSKDERRLSVVQQTAKYLKAPMVYVNLVGGQDELIFDGGSIAVNPNGEILAESVYFDEDLNVFDLDSQSGGIRPFLTSRIKSKEKKNEFYREALVAGIRDFVHKNKMQKVHLGLSGGVDSALVACLAVDALGPGKVTCVALPTKFNADESYELAKQLSKNLGCKFFSLPIESTYQKSLTEFENCFGSSDFDLMNENLQARIRGTMLMAYSNRYSSMLLATGNKSEFTVGYSTLYGDMNGGLAPIGDLLKTEVFSLCEHYNREFELIPQRIITRPPSAELRPDQMDQDSLPDYKDLDKSVQKVVVECRPATSPTDKFVLQKLNQSEFKRWQAPPILRVSPHAYGTGRRFPITNGSSK